MMLLQKRVARKSLHTWPPGLGGAWLGGCRSTPLTSQSSSGFFFSGSVGITQVGLCPFMIELRRHAIGLDRAADCGHHLAECDVDWGGIVRERRRLEVAGCTTRQAGGAISWCDLQASVFTSLVEHLFDMGAPTPAGRWAGLVVAGAGFDALVAADILRDPGWAWRSQWAPDCLPVGLCRWSGRR